MNWPDAGNDEYYDEHGVDNGNHDEDGDEDDDDVADDDYIHRHYSNQHKHDISIHMQINRSND